MSKQKSGSDKMAIETPWTIKDCGKVYERHRVIRVKQEAYNYSRGLREEEIEHIVTEAPNWRDGYIIWIRRK